MTLYHYTDQSGFMGIFLEQELWATKIQYLNDEKEYSLALDLTRIQLQCLVEKYVQENNSALVDKLNYYIDCIPNIKDMNICVSSLTENGDLLSQWRGYSRKLGGYSIGFNKLALQPFVHLKGFELAQCVYETTAQNELIKNMINSVLDDFKSKPEDQYTIGAYNESSRVFLQRLAKIAPLLKDSSFTEECEWRIIAEVNYENLDFRSGSSMLMPFCKIKLNNIKNVYFNSLIDEVIVGHTPNPELAVSATEAFILKHFPPKSGNNYICPIDVKISKIPFRNW